MQPSGSCALRTRAPAIFSWTQNEAREGFDPVTVTTGWKNRITGTGEESPEQLLANPQNWRIHPQHQQEALAGVLNEVGWVQQVIVNQRSGHLVDGHLRVQLALRRDEPMVPVVYVDLDEAEESLILASLDPLAALAGTDREKLDELLRDVSTGEAAVQQMLSELAERNGVIPPDDFDSNAEWVGMPEFQQEDQMPYFQLIVNFASPDAIERFSEFVEQPISATVGEKTKSIWYPKVARNVRKHTGYVADES